MSVLPADRNAPFAAWTPELMDQASAEYEARSAELNQARQEAYGEGRKDEREALQKLGILIDCRACKGVGEREVFDSSMGPYEGDGGIQSCPDCKGTGDARGVGSAAIPPVKAQGEATGVVDVGLMEYRGNSVSFIHSKMMAYRLGLDNAWAALREAGIQPDGKTDIAAAIRRLAAPPVAGAAGTVGEAALLAYLESQKFHPSASHVPPDYRDGYNHALRMVIDRIHVEQDLRATLPPTPPAAGTVPIEAGGGALPPAVPALDKAFAESIKARDAIEAKAREIYDGWKSMPGWVPWVEGGNSHKQDDARRIAAVGVEVDYGFRCYSCTKEWEGTTPEADCPNCGTTNSASASNPRGVPAVETKQEKDHG